MHVVPVAHNSVAHDDKYERYTFLNPALLDYLPHPELFRYFVRKTHIPICCCVYSKLFLSTLKNQIVVICSKYQAGMFNQTVYRFHVSRCESMNQSPSDSILDGINMCDIVNIITFKILQKRNVK